MTSITTLGRRAFLQFLSSAALTAALPQSIERALAIPAHQHKGSIEDVEHVVFLMQADGSTDAANGKFRIDFANTGEAGACLQVRSGNTADGPRTYTVEAGKSLSDTWSVDAQGRYDLSVYGPNGFMRAFKGAVSQPAKANLDVDFSYDRDDRDIMLRITNLGRVTCRVTVTNIYDHGAATHVLRPGQSFRERWSLGSSFGWYDLSVEVDTDENFLRRLAGHVENGRDSMSDPALGGLRRIGHAQSRVAIVG